MQLFDFSQSSFQTIRAVLNQAQQQLHHHGKSNARREARILLSYLLNRQEVDLITRDDELISEDLQHTYFQLVERRCHHEPLSRIIGSREFWGLPFTISSATLDPRPDSETLIETVLKYTPQKSKCIQILDLGTGSGCLLLALLSELSQAVGIGIDINPDAIETAKNNAQYLKLQQRASFFKHDWQQGILSQEINHLISTIPISQSQNQVSSKFDWIISNPPYIPTLDIASLQPEVYRYDPLLALDGGNDGLDPYRYFSQHLHSLLKPNGSIALEIGQNQHQAIEEIFLSQGYENVSWARDLSGIIRCGIFRHP